MKLDCDAGLSENSTVSPECSSTPPPLSPSSNVFHISKESCVIRLNLKRAGQCRPQNNAFVMHCSTLCYITLITALLQLSLQQRREHCRIVLYLRNGVSTGKGGIYFRRFGLVRYSYCRITRFCCHCEFTLPLAYFAVHFLCFASSPDPLPFIECLSFPLNYLVAFCLWVSFTCLFK